MTHAAARQMLKRGAERTLIATGIAALSRRRLTRRAIVLTYHNVVPDNGPTSGDRSLHLPRTRFVQHLDAIESVADIVPLDAALRPDAGARRPRVAITFDDGYRGAVTIGIPFLAARGLPTTVFVSPGLIASEGFWWDRLAQPGDGLSPATRAHVLDALGGDHAAVRQWAGPGRLQLVPAILQAATCDELTSLAALSGVSIGSHTWGHLNLNQTDPTTLAAELVRSNGWLRDHFACSVPWLAYPYGLLSAPVVQGAAAAGYTLAFALGGGWIPHPVNALAVPRLNVPAGMTADGLILRLSGLWGTGSKGS